MAVVGAVVKGAGKLGKLGKVGMGLAVFDGAMEYRYRQNENPGESGLHSFAAAAMTTAAWTVAPGFTAGYEAIKFGKQLGESQGNAQREWRRSAWDRSRATFGGNFQDTQIGATMRQRGVQAIQESRLQAHSHLANEARSLHRF